jgi:folate-binding protein YgfZ
MADLMIEWQQFLAQQGANFGEEVFPQLLGFHGQGTTPPKEADSETDFVTPLIDQGLIAWSGDEAASFLHNQLTNDVENLGATEVRLAGYCSPKGRLLATFLYWRSDNRIMLQLPRQIQATVQKRLQMFVMRAKAKSHDASDEFVVLGLAGHASSTVLRTWFAQLPSAPFDKHDTEAGTLICLPNTNGSPRYQWVTSPTMAMQAWPLLTQSLRATGPQAWRLADIRTGIPTVTQQTQEQFVPQMINFELIGGVNFKKGCYPGQEIVARSQYLGKLKRRMLLATVSGAQALPGMEVFAGIDPGQPCGMVVNAESVGPDTSEFLVEIKLAAIEGGVVHLGSADGAALTFKTLPYAFPDSPQ